MARTVIESQYGFVSIARASAALAVTTHTDPLDDLTAEAMNWAVGEMEAYTGRPLALRTFRTAFTLANQNLTAQASNTKVVGDASNVRAFDDVLGAGALQGSRVQSVQSAAIFYLDRVGTSGPSDLTVGSKPLI